MCIRSRNPTNPQFWKKYVLSTIAIEKLCAHRRKVSQQEVRVHCTSPSCACQSAGHYFNRVNEAQLGTKQKFDEFLSLGKKLLEKHERATVSINDPLRIDALGMRGRCIQSSSFKDQGHKLCLLISPSTSACCLECIRSVSTLLLALLKHEGGHQ